MLPRLQCMLQNASYGEVIVFFMAEVKNYNCLYNKYSKSYKSGQVYEDELLDQDRRNI